MKNKFAVPEGSCDVLEKKIIIKKLSFFPLVGCKIKHGMKSQKYFILEMSEHFYLGTLHHIKLCMPIF